MDESVSGIKFYELKKDNEIELSVKDSRKFNEALFSVVKKDIEKLEMKLKEMIKEIIKLSAKTGISKIRFHGQIVLATYKQMTEPPVTILILLSAFLLTIKSKATNSTDIKTKPGVSVFRLPK